MPSWGELLNELQPHKNENGEDVQGLTVDELREKYLNVVTTNRKKCNCVLFWVA